jgi:hypothetical protein
VRPGRAARPRLDPAVAGVVRRTAQGRARRAATKAHIRRDLAARGNPQLRPVRQGIPRARTKPERFTAGGPLMYEGRVIRPPTRRQARGPRLAAKGAPPRGGRNVSKRQQRWAFWSKQTWAHATARRGAAYAALPERKRRTRTAR